MKSGLRRPAEPDTILGTDTAAEFFAGGRACLPLVLGYTVVGLAFGVVARTAGLSATEVAVMSLLLYAGASQFIVVALLGTGAAASVIVATVFLVNLRHLLYSAALAPHVRRLPLWQNALIGTELTDETFAVAASHLQGDRQARAPWMFGLNLTAQATWIATTTLGALVGRAIPDTHALGLDFALAAMFAALLVGQITARPRVRLAVTVAAIGAIVAVGAALVVPPSWAVIVAALVAATIGTLLEGRFTPRTAGASKGGRFVEEMTGAALEEQSAEETASWT